MNKIEKKALKALSEALGPQRFRRQLPAARKLTMALSKSVFHINRFDRIFKTKNYQNAIKDIEKAIASFVKQAGKVRIKNQDESSTAGAEIIDATQTKE